MSGAGLPLPLCQPGQDPERDECAREEDFGRTGGRWYPTLKNSVSIAVTEKRTRKELDGLVAAFQAALK